MASQHKVVAIAMTATWRCFQFPIAILAELRRPRKNSASTAKFPVSSTLVTAAYRAVCLLRKAGQVSAGVTLVGERRFVTDLLLVWCLTVGPDQRRNELVGRYKALQGGPGAQCP